MPNTAGEEARRRLGRRKQDERREREGKRRGRWRRRLVTDRWIGLASLHLEALRFVRVPSVGVQELVL
jgi:hypothetical protein